ncbi:hypothetical protein CDD80_6934 [Ophiocordyceps camponoti-rufipedis]|uniref:rRNA biogenesis protein RRP5 n=1 Tax=Ophiocordyceps camponoti-rufipedis TaxID=2004952 RepID=A0A2C5YNY8_9HYPO|nr:hypothetical protein CDD80_6934 [Ophiocordyceps camponoti-rufipedis]
MLADKAAILRCVRSGRSAARGTTPCGFATSGESAVVGGPRFDRCLFRGSIALVRAHRLLHERKAGPSAPPPSTSVKKVKPTKSDVSKTTDDDGPKQTPVVSLLRNEEPMFPRGGGSILTPLEKRQIHLDARADALRDEEFGGAAPVVDGKKRRRMGKDEGKGKKTVVEEPGVKVESLNFKKLVKGSLVLAQVSRIDRLNLQLSLPYNLSGHVSILAVSDQLTTRLDEAARQDDDDDAEESADDSANDDVNLRSIFAVGQYLRAYVVSTAEESLSGKPRRKIELSLRPVEANAGLSVDDVVPCSTVMASVVSVEDHGCVMDLGVSGLRGFLSADKIDASVQSQRLQSGAVFLCRVLAKGSGGSVAQLSLLQEDLARVGRVPAEATTINTYLPGTPATLLISAVDRRGVVGSIMGHLNATADVVHSGAGPNGIDLETKYKVGSKVKARIICNFPNAKEPKVGVSLLPHVTGLTRKRSDADELPTDVLPVSSAVDECVVRHVETEIGLFVDTGVAGLPGFVHISRVKDGKVDALFEGSGPYRLQSVHKGRVVGYSELDGLFHLSFQKSILEQQYIRLEDVPAGAIVTCDVEKLVIKEHGVSGIIVKIADGITGFVAERHLADVSLQHPEKKFREGMKVKARVLSVNPFMRRMRLTLKKTLVNSEAPAVAKLDQVVVGMHMPGTIVKLQPNGAQIQFYGSVRGFLPVSEMSEAYVRDPADHFRVGQVVSVHVVDVNAEQRRLIVSCKDPSAFGLDKQNALRSLSAGELVSAKVTEKTEDQIIVELEGSQLRAILPMGHLTDKSPSKNSFAFKRISAGQTLSGLMVIDKHEQRRAITLTQKPSLVRAFKDGKFPVSLDDVKVGDELCGFVRDVTSTAVFVQFAGGVYGVLPKSRLSTEAQSQPGFGLQKNESIDVRVLSLVPDQSRVLLAPASGGPDEAVAEPRPRRNPAPDDGIAFGSIVTAKITSIKQTQLNVQLVGKEIHGRIDVSQVFDSWDAIATPKKPLGKFHRNQQLRVKVVGIHNTKDHRFLPFSHRSTHSVLELTAKPSDVKAETPELLTLESIKVGDSHIAFVNNVTSQFLWVNLSPTVRGRISAMEASDDVTQLNDLGASFPIGSALKVTVKSVDVINKHLDLSARSSVSEPVTWDSLRPDMVVPGKVVNVSGRQLLVRLGDAVTGPVQLPDMADDYGDVEALKFRRGDMVRVSVVEVDAANQLLRLSLRPSRIMSSTMAVVDKEISHVSQLTVGDVVRGFVKNISDKGLFVLLGGQVTAMVKITNLSDRFIKSWKDEFKVDQLVKGRVIAVDLSALQVELNLRASVVDENYKAPLGWKDIQAGQVVTGKVRKVEEFGAFIVVDDSTNVSGLCHRSEMADAVVRDAKKLYREGDVVKALVLDVDADKRRISFGLKPSLLEEKDEEMEDEDSDAGGVSVHSDAEMDDVDFRLKGADEDVEDDGEDDDDQQEGGQVRVSETGGLGAGKKSAWSTDPFHESAAESGSEDDEDKQTAQRKRKRRKAGESAVQIDRTGELDAHGPQTASDYERLLLGQSDSSELWIAYMAFQMQVSELAKAREVAERAIRTINVREEREKLNVWVAYLNLEVTYGTKKEVDEVFRRACEYCDGLEVHERLASIYIQSEKLKEADELLETMIKKFGSQSPSVWTNYAHFLHVTLGQPARARALLPRAMQQLDKRHHPQTISRFGALEFRSANGEPERGRTMFAGLLATWPKKGDLWSQLVDLEIAVRDEAAVRDVFEKRLRVKGLKPVQAERWFRKWTAWEESEAGRERVMAKAREWTAVYKAKREAE